MPTLPPISADANKYTRGSLLVLAGSKRYSGAGVLTTLAAEATGAGYVSLATPLSVAPAARHHLLCSPVIEAPEERELGCFSKSALQPILSMQRPTNALCSGPGLMANAHTASFIKELLLYASREQIPLLLDADALNILAACPALLSMRWQQVISNLSRDAQYLSPLVLTPHRGELERLYAAFIQEVNLSREGAQNAIKLEVSEAEAALSLSNKLNAIIVAKGPTTTIALQNDIYESNEGTAALARAGTGDVLAGVISGLIAQGLKALEAARLGVHVHSLAGVRAEQKLGRRSVTALDVIHCLPEVMLAIDSGASAQELKPG
ncbi:MAG: NAD(P)H-hydrate dehydratase [Coriobacteriia bacterium]|nr:NAD(P)H-hydrate dehydratase [Coriobacteriia bacterium]